MSELRWCNVGNHAMNGDDPDAKQFASTKLVNDKREIVDICGVCARKGWGSLTDPAALMGGPSRDSEEATVVPESPGYL